MTIKYRFGCKYLTVRANLSCCCPTFLKFVFASGFSYSTGKRFVSIYSINKIHRRAKTICFFLSDPFYMEYKLRNNSLIKTSAIRWFLFKWGYMFNLFGRKLNERGDKVREKNKSVSIPVCRVRLVNRVVNKARYWTRLRSYE
jgi:hypothetical protein